jgi:deoxyribonuclease V
MCSDPQTAIGVQGALPHWPISEVEATALQKQLAGLVVTEDRLDEPIRRVAGVDVAYADEGNRAFAAVALLDVDRLTLDSIVSAEAEARFPYSSGLLSFRELPILAAAFDKLGARPDLVICDGQGIAHPRRFGLACHVGVVYDVPTIGCAKTHLIGEAGEPDLARGSIAQLLSEGEIIGSVLRTRDGVKPLYVSPGHRISIGTACKWVLQLTPRYRLPEPIRIADQVVNRMKREAK